MNDFTKHAQALSVIAKGLELMATLDKQQRRSVVMGLLLGSLDADDPEDRKILAMFDRRAKEAGL